MKKFEKGDLKVEIEEDTDIVTTPRSYNVKARVNTEYIKVDRNYVFGWSVPNFKLADRLSKCIVANRAFSGYEILKDTQGKSYINAPSLIFGKTMNADLTKLGF